MKGYIVSFSAIVLLSSMLLFAGFYSANVKERNISVNEMKKYSKLEFVKDDLGFDLNKMLGTEIEIAREENLTMVFRESIPADFNKMKRIVKLKEFIESSYSSINNSSISFNIGRLNNSVPVKFSNRLVYEYGFNSGSSVYFYAENGDTNISSMDLNLNVEGSSVSVSFPADSLTPNLSVNFNYVDQNALNETHENLQLGSSLDNVILISFSDTPNDEIEIHIGSFDGKINAMQILNKTSNQEKINLVFKAIMNALDLNSGFNAFVDADLNYIQTDLNSNGLIELKQFS